MLSEATELVDMLRAERDRLQDRKRQLQERLLETEQEIQAIVQRLGHIDALLQDDPSGDNGTSVVEEATAAEVATGPASNDPAEIAYMILMESRGQPIHYKELTQSVIQKGGVLIGTDPAQTLIARLVRDERFVRPFRRGYYALRIDYPKARNVGGRNGGGRNVNIKK